MKILQEDGSYTFHSYFELPNDTDEILAEFGYTFDQKRLLLPRTARSLPGLVELQQQIEATLPYVRLTSETAKGEILVAPVLSRVAVLSRQILRIEYSIKVNSLLQGNLDYLLRSKHSLVVVEAKRDDLTRGFTQLAIEMIALALLENTPDRVYGAVTIGSVWIFGLLEAATRTVKQDIGSYTLPDDLSELVHILVGILEEA